MKPEKMTSRLGLCITASQRQWLDVYARTNGLRITSVVRDFIQQIIDQYHEQWGDECHQARLHKDRIIILHDAGHSIESICSATQLSPQGIRIVIEECNDVVSKN